MANIRKTLRKQEQFIKICMRPKNNADMVQHMNYRIRLWTLQSAINILNQTHRAIEFIVRDTKKRGK